MSLRQDLERSLDEAPLSLAALAKQAACRALRKSAGEHLLAADKFLELGLKTDAARSYRFAADDLDALHQNEEGHQ